MVDFIKVNMVSIFVGAVITIALVWWIYCNRKGLLKKAALYAVSKAEEAWGSDTGKIKFAEVYTYIQKQYPIVTLFFTEAQITLIIEEALDQMKSILASKESIEKAKTLVAPTYESIIDDADVINNNVSIQSEVSNDTLNESTANIK